MTKNVTEHVEPQMVIQALQDPSWIETMQEELLQFKLQQVWTLMDLPHGKRAIGTKWVYKNKKDERDIVIRNKARLVAQGYTQEEGIDYDEVFAPVARIEGVRMFLAYASFKDFVVYQMDVKSAFLYGKIEEEVYVCQPLGFEDPKFPNKVYKVEKELYGLHQAPRAWYETLSTYLLDNGFQRGQIDKTLFIKIVKGDILLVQVYVDDIIFGSTKKELCTEFEKLMHKKFQMSSMGELTFLLGLQVSQKDYGIFISQDKYVDGILKNFGFSTVKTTSTPMETSKPLLKDAEAEDVDVHLYRSMIRSLMYLTASRPDIIFAVCACARFQVTPKVSHLHVVKRIFRYLKDLQEEPTPIGDQFGPSTPPVPKTTKQLAAKRNQERVKSILLLAIPNEYLLKFHNVPDAKSLWEAIKSRFRGNEESKKMQKNVLKHQFENFTTAQNKSLDKAYDKFQKLISQLEVYAAPVSKEDINQIFLRSLPHSWSQIALIMRNKPDIDEIDIDDLYNNLRVYEDEIKSTASGDFGIDEDDLEELDLRWQVAMLTGTLLGNADLEGINVTTMIWAGTGNQSIECDHLNEIGMVVSFMRILRLREMARATARIALEFAPEFGYVYCMDFVECYLLLLGSYAFSVSLLLTPLCCDDIHDVTPRVSALAGCDRLVSEPMVIEN
ncbi:putative ribonuclease H-like domain-containing protein [Tanacetum coccineum]